MKYKVKDLQIEGRYLWEEHEFKNIKEIIEALSDYHSIDWSGQLEEGEDCEIDEFLNITFTNDKDKLDYLLDYGEWELEEVK